MNIQLPLDITYEVYLDELLDKRSAELNRQKIGGESPPHGKG